MELLSRSRPVTALSWGYVIPLFIVVIFSWLNWNIQVDDALIYLRYVRNVIEGNGLVYNVGERFNGLTSPLNSYLVVAAAWLLRNFQLAMIGLSAVFFAGAVLLNGPLLAKTRLEALFTAAVIGATGYFYSTFGLETTLFLFFIGLSLHLYKRESDWVVISLALLLITRSEGVFLCAVIGLDYLWRYRRLPDWRFLAAAAVIILLPYLFNYFYYGSFVAATASAKIGQGRSGLWGDSWLFLDTAYFVPWFLHGSLVTPFILALLALIGVLATIRDRITIIILLFVLLLATFYIGLNIPNYHWYYAPFVLFTLAFACRGLFFLIPLARGPFSYRAVAAGFAAIGMMYALAHIVSFQRGTGNPDYVAIGKWLNENTPEDASVAMVEIGIVGWYSGRRVIDILGLVNPYNAELIGQKDFTGWLKHYQPDYILSHKPAWAHEQSIPLLEQSTLYQPVEFPFPDYVLLERAPQYPPEMVVEFVEYTEANDKYLRALRNSSNVGAPILALDSTGLFAHPPITLAMELDEAVEGLEVHFGIRDTARDLHSGVCFHVRSDTRTLMTRCIEKGAAVEELEQTATIEQFLPAGQRLDFEIDCPVSCDYGWTYWRQVKDKDLPDFVSLLQQM